MLLLRFPATADDAALQAILMDAGVETQTLSSHFAGKHREQGLLLSFAGFQDDDLRGAQDPRGRNSRMSFSRMARA